ncbi:uncharacterized protein IUM83_12820 [Phytophthora cinnamomi]|uniref:uncharacterized protein n=1 Tax=Phytophthora cinnamomi TaxID=4785 RepID=UPI00355A35C1|nr:hypothetical protein IUM83_12820 [Phytophthora cinnamomi]
MQTRIVGYTAVRRPVHREVLEDAAVTSRALQIDMKAEHECVPTVNFEAATRAEYTFTTTVMGNIKALMKKTKTNQADIMVQQ